MRTVNLHGAKRKLSRLLDAAAAGEQITITKEGKPMVKLVRVGAEEKVARTGFLAGQGHIPENYDTLYSQKIAESFDDAV